jgi:dolichol-phosphate mannosyltransferase
VPLQASEEPVVSVVAPMYNEAGNVERFVVAVDAVLGQQGLSYEIVLVDDGSRDDTWQRICDESVRNPRVRGLSLSRNFGQQNALFAGMHHARGQAVISMDGDLQHPPALIPDLLKAWQEGYQIVTTTRQDSADTGWFKRLTSRWFYKVFSRLSGTSLSFGTSDFRLVDAQARDAMLEMRDTDLFLRGMVSWLGFRTTSIPFEAGSRQAGDTKYTLGRMVRFSMGATLVFSMLPLRMGIWLGFLTTILAFAQIVYVVVSYFQGNTVRGWSTVIVLMSSMFAVTFVLLGVIGVYLGKIFEILKGRQRFIVSRYAGFAERPARRAIRSFE